LFDHVSRLKQNLPEEECAAGSDVIQAYRVYEDRLTDEGALDLDDLLIHAVRLLREDPTATRRIQETFAHYLCVDEFQMSTGSTRWSAVAGGNGSRLFVIGPDQAIYGFRGADWRFFGAL
jgi:superfamily I DNA/RNA helicase